MRFTPRGFTPWRSLSVRILIGLAGTVFLMLAISFLEFHPPVPPTPPLHRIDPGVSGFQFYNAGCADHSSNREYSYRFMKREARCIFAQLYVNHLVGDTTPAASFHAIFYDPNEQAMGEEKVLLTKDVSAIILTVHHGWDEPGHWQSGVYRVELTIEAKLIAAGEFEIIDP